MSCDIVIEHGLVMTMDAKGTVIQDGAVAVKGGKVIEVGSTEEVAGAHRARKVVDAGRGVVIPGLINTHAHAASSFMRSVGDEMPFNEWHSRCVLPLWHAMTGEEVYQATLLGAAEMLLTGTTCVNEFSSHRHSEEAARAFHDIGIRAFVSHSISEFGPSGSSVNGVVGEYPEEGRKRLQENVDLVKRWDGKGGGRIRCKFGPIFASGCSPGLLKEIRRLATEYKTGVHMHLAESIYETEYIKKAYGKSVVQFLEGIGFLGPDIVGAHALQLSNEDIQILKKTGTKLAICPTSEAKLNALMAPFPEIERAGIPLALGTDSAACQNSFDMFQEMKFTALLNKFATKNPRAMTAGRVLEMATIGGARVLSVEGSLGSIEEGKFADLTIISARSVGMIPRIDAVGNLVYGSNPRVESVVVDGKMIVERGRLATVDEDKVIRDSADMVEGMMERVASKIDCPSLKRSYEVIRNRRRYPGRARRRSR